MNHTIPTSTKLDLTTWPRREHFAFFNTFDEPFYGVTISIDCTAAYSYVKQQGISFHFYCLYQSLTAAHQIDAFRYRIVGPDVILYDRIDAGPAIDRPDGTFGFGHLPYSPDLDEFIRTSNLESARVRATPGLTLTTGDYLIYYSVLPWLDFTSLSHARNFAQHDSCPRITFGRMTAVADTRTMPVSIHVNHALVDGLQLGQYVEALQAAMNSR